MQSFEFVSFKLFISFRSMSSLSIHAVSLTIFVANEVVVVDSVSNVVAGIVVVDATS